MGSQGQHPLLDGSVDGGESRLALDARPLRVGKLTLPLGASTTAGIEGGKEVVDRGGGFGRHWV